jgi:hypothetical protein
MPTRLRRLLACFALVALLLPAAAVAGSAQARDPEDQARAKAMLLRKSDLVPGSVARGRASDFSILTGLDCPGLRSADIEPTGYAGTPTFTRPGLFVSSQATILGTTADADLLWRDLGGKAGRACLAKVLRQAFVGDGAVISFGTISFPRVGQRTLAFRLVAEVRGVRATMDWVMTKRARAIGSLVAGAVGSGVVRSFVVRWARTVAGRMQTAMREA